MLSEISRKAAIREAKQLADATQEEYIHAQQKARAGEEMVRKIHQKEADNAMEVSVCVFSQPNGPDKILVCPEREAGTCGRDEDKATTICVRKSQERNHPSLKPHPPQQSAVLV